MGCTCTGVERQSPSVMGDLLKPSQECRCWLGRRDSLSRGRAPALAVTRWDGPGRAGMLLPAPFRSSSNFCPQGSSEHGSESLSAFATPLTQGGTPAPLLPLWQGKPTTAGLTGKHWFIFLIISNGCGSALTADNYSLPLTPRFQTL